jgi:segregation and condensation protein B
MSDSTNPLPETMPTEPAPHEPRAAEASVSAEADEAVQAVEEVVAAVDAGGQGAALMAEVNAPPAAEAGAAEGIVTGTPESGEAESLAQQPADGAQSAESSEIVADAAESVGLDLTFAMQVLEAALLSATDPVSAQVLRRLFEPDIGAELMNRLLADLQTRWEGRSAELVRLASGWRFQTRSLYQPYLDRLKETRAPRYSRAVLETLAIIVYRQPVTRGDIEEIRGVTVSSQIMKLLEMRGWIDTIGHRDTPGRPALYATTKKFLDDLGLRSLTELPPLAELEGVLDLVDTAEAASSTPTEQLESPGEPGREYQIEEQSSDGTSAGADDSTPTPSTGY